MHKFGDPRTYFCSCLYNDKSGLKFQEPLSLAFGVSHFRKPARYTHALTQLCISLLCMRAGGFFSSQLGVNKRQSPYPIKALYASYSSYSLSWHFSFSARMKLKTTERSGKGIASRDWCGKPRLKRGTRELGASGGRPTSDSHCEILANEDFFRDKMSNYFDGLWPVGLK